jgi:putative ABC transport system substrate-binding protein
VIARRDFLTSSAAIIAAPLVAGAQQAVRAARIGLLDAGPPRPELWAPLKLRLNELGYTEGQHISFVSRWAHDDVNRLPSLAAELVAQRVDVLVTTGTPPAQAAKQATSSTPIVMASGGDPVGRELVTSLSKPGGNVTGVTSLASELAAKRVELIRELVPKLVRLALLSDLTNPAHTTAYRETRAATEAVGAHLQVVGVQGAHDLGTAFAALSRERAEALIVQPSAPFLSQRRRLAELALNHRLPTAFGRRDYVDAGGLISYAASFRDLLRSAADYVDRILKGAKPAELPVQRATTFELVINLRTARTLGLTIPPSLLLRADHVLE